MCFFNLIYFVLFHLLNCQKTFKTAKNILHVFPVVGVGAHAAAGKSSIDMSIVNMLYFACQGVIT